jgi:hypothetical protein
MKSPQMFHRTVANAQVGLSYFFLAGFFTVLILSGLGVLKVDVTHFLEGGATMVLSYWFMRQRSSTDEPMKESDPVPSNPQKPVEPAKVSTP